MSVSSRSNDALEQFLSAADGSAAETALSALLCSHATPLIRRVLRPKACRADEDVEDLVQGVLLRLVARLRVVRSGAAGDARIEEFDSYVAAVAHRVRAEDIRGKHPEHRRLRRKLRHALSRDQRFSMWADGRGQWLCGSAAASAANERSPAAPSELRRVMVAAVTGPTPYPRAETLADLHLALSTLGRPVKLDVIVNLFRDARGDEAGVPCESSLVASVASPEAQIVDRQFLSRLWHEIRRLPVPQRKALLLNLSDAQGRDLIALLPLTGTASMRDIALALEMAPEDLASLWGSLPLDDRAIGERLGLSRQQVINLRSAARRRLARRLGVGR